MSFFYDVAVFLLVLFPTLQYVSRSTSTSAESLLKQLSVSFASITTWTVLKWIPFIPLPLDFIFYLWVGIMIYSPSWINVAYENVVSPLAVSQKETVIMAQDLIATTINQMVLVTKQKVSGLEWSQWSSVSKSAGPLVFLQTQFMKILDRLPLRTKPKFVSPIFSNGSIAPTITEPIENQVHDDEQKDE